MTWELDAATMGLAANGCYGDLRNVSGVPVTPDACCCSKRNSDTVTSVTLPSRRLPSLVSNVSWLFCNVNFPVDRPCFPLLTLTSTNVPSALSRMANASVDERLADQRPCREFAAI